MRIRFERTWIRIACLVIAFFIANGVGNTAPEGPRIADSAPKLSPVPTSRDSIGSLKGVPIAIPSGYIFFGAEYEGEDQWSGKRVKGAITYDTPIQSISLRVHLPDVAPLTAQNEATWQQFLKMSREESDWIIVAVEARQFDVSGAGWVQGFVARHREGQNTDPAGWHYERQGEKRFGLTTESLVGGRDRAKHWISDRDLLYDADGWRVVMLCDAHGSRPSLMCMQFFPIPEINAYVNVHYHITRLKDWSDMQNQLTGLIKQFVASGRAAAAQPRRGAVPE